MKTTKYLYDCEPSEFMNLKYKDAIEFKKNKAAILFIKLTLKEEEFYKNGKKYDDDNVTDLRLRLKNVTEAVDHNRKLIEELKEMEKENENK